MSKTYQYTSPAAAAIRVYDTVSRANRIVRQGDADFRKIVLDSTITVQPYSTPPGPSIRRITPLTFINRIPADALGAIAAAIVSSPVLMVWVLKLVASQEVNLDLPETQGGVAAMVGAGLLTQAQANALLA
jgi:hypothetical protein